MGDPEESVAWEILNFEYSELGNEHILEDLRTFLKTKGNWSSLLEEFRRRYGDIQGVWVCPTVEDAVYYYGHYYGPGAVIYEWEYSPENVVIDLGPDGIFVLEPKMVGEKGKVKKGAPSVRRG